MKTALTFKQAVKKAEYLASIDLYNRYCVVLMHGTYATFSVSEARDHDYHVVCETIA